MFIDIGMGPTQNVPTYFETDVYGVEDQGVMGPALGCVRCKITDNAAMQSLDFSVTNLECPECGESYLTYTYTPPPLR
jgi:hypothetical protein